MNREDFRLGEEDRRVRELGERRQETEVESMGFLRGGSAHSGEVEGTPWKTISLANLSMRPPSAAD